MMEVGDTTAAWRGNTPGTRSGYDADGARSPEPPVKPP